MSLPYRASAYKNRNIVAQRRPLLWASVLLLVGLALTAWTVREVSEAIRVDVQAQFNRQVAHAKQEVQAQLERPLAAMRAVQALIQSRQGLTQTEFGAFVHAATQGHAAQGIQGLGVMDAGKDSVPYRVKLFQSLVGNPSILSQSADQQDALKDAVEQAITRGDATIFHPENSHAKSPNAPVFLYLMPVYGSDEAIDTPTERKASLQSILFAEVVISELLTNTDELTQGVIDLTVLDNNIGGASQPLFDSRQKKGLTGSSLSKTVDTEKAHAFETSGQLVVAGRPFAIHADCGHKLEPYVSQATPWLLGIGGTLLSSILAFSFWILARGRSRAVARARSMTLHLQHERDRLEQSEARLRDSEAFLTRAGLIAGTGSWQVELPNGEITWSEQTCRIHEVPPDYQPSLSQALSFYPSEARPLIRGAIEAAIQHGKSWDLELPLITANGQHIWVRSAGEADQQNGKLVRLVGIIRDITTRRKLEDEIRQKNEFMTNILANIPVGLTAVDRHMNVVADNPLFRDLLDLPESLFKAPFTPFEDVIRFNAERGEYGPGDPQELVKSIMDRARHTRPHRFERQRANGMTLEVRGAPMPDGGFVTTYADISERKKAEELLLQKEQLLRGAIDAIDEAFILFDANDRMVYCNEKTRQLFPLSADVIVPDVTFEKVIRTGAERGEYVRAMGHVDAWVAKGMAIHRQGNATHVHQLGDGRWLRSVHRRLPDGHTVGFHVDITHLKNASVVAEEASRAKSQFLANMSHEIRTPMNAILGMIQLIQSTALTPRQSDYATKAEDATRSLLWLVNQILDFSKVESGKLALDLHPFQIDQIMSNLSVILSANIGAKPVDVLFDLDPSIPHTLIGDAMRLQQVLINLGGNAIKFTSQGEVMIRLRITQQTGQQVVLHVAVQDQGIGIAPENQVHIFDGFSQAEASTTRRFGGTGLGLSICKRLVELMGGQLVLESELGQGSTFYFEIPLTVAAAQSDSAAALPAPEAPTFPALLVTNHAKSLPITERMMKALGWQVDACTTGEDAIQKVESKMASGAFPYRTIVLDATLPGMDGWQTALRLQTLRADAADPILIMVSAHELDTLTKRQQVAQFAPIGFIVKPLTAVMLQQTVEGARAASKQTATAPINSRPLSGLRLLLVEDNLINQQVAQELLNAEGAVVSIAANGQLGVAAVANARVPFDAVLMDLQMPVMDGLAATHVIRNELGHVNLPIIAMTANAMDADRNACIAAGMNDHIGKPFDLPNLVATLLRHTGRALAMPTMVLDTEDSLKRLGGNGDLYRNILHTYLADIANASTELHHLLDSGQTEQAKNLLHTLKGTSATVGAKQLAIALSNAGEALKVSPDPLDIDRLLSAIDAALPQVQAAIREQLHHFTFKNSNHRASPDLPDDKLPLLANLQQLADLLANSDMSAIAIHAELKKRSASIPSAPWDLLDRSINALDFAKAREHCIETIAMLKPELR